MTNILERNLINTTFSRLDLLISQFINSKLESYISLYIFEYLNNKDSINYSNFKSYIRHDLEKNIFQYIKNFLYKNNLQSNIDLNILAEQISYKVQPIIQEKFEVSIIQAQKYIHATTLLEKAS